MVRSSSLARNMGTQSGQDMRTDHTRLADIDTWLDAYGRLFKFAQLSVCGKVVCHLAPRAQDGDKSPEHWHVVIHSLMLQS